MSFNNLFFRIKQYVRYWLLREDAHSLQSSVMYDLYTHALIAKKEPVDQRVVELRDKYMEDDRVVLQKFGAYSDKPKRTKVSHIAKSGISSFRDSLILKSLINYSKSENVLELGSSIGLNAIVLSSCHNVSITSIDIDPVLTALACENSECLDLDSSIDFVNADVDYFIDSELSKGITYDFIYVDANHTFEATLRYYTKLKSLLDEQGIIVFDDINWSKSMNEAWLEIKKDIQQGLVIENYTMGIWVKNSNPKGAYLLGF